MGLGSCKYNGTSAWLIVVPPIEENVWFHRNIRL
jgi:hypothetical protein